MMITGAAVPALVSKALKLLAEMLAALKNKLLGPNPYWPYTIYHVQESKEWTGKQPANTGKYEHVGLGPAYGGIIAIRKLKQANAAKSIAINEMQLDLGSDIQIIRQPVREEQSKTNWCYATCVYLMCMNNLDTGKKDEIKNIKN